MRYATRQRKSVAERLWKKVAIKGPDECWPFVGAHDTFGYGVLLGEWPERRQVAAHRAMWVTKVGPIPEGCDIRQCCRVKDCVNPSHLRLWGRRTPADPYTILASGAAVLAAGVVITAMQVERQQAAEVTAE